MKTPCWLLLLVVSVVDSRASGEGYGERFEPPDPRINAKLVEDVRMAMKVPENRAEVFRATSALAGGVSGVLGYYAAKEQGAIDAAERRKELLGLRNTLEAIQREQKRLLRAFADSRDPQDLPVQVRDSPLVVGARSRFGDIVSPVASDGSTDVTARSVADASKAALEFADKAVGIAAQLGLPAREVKMARDGLGLLVSASSFFGTGGMDFMSGLGLLSSAVGLFAKRSEPSPEMQMLQDIARTQRQILERLDLVDQRLARIEAQLDVVISLEKSIFDGLSDPYLVGAQSCILLLDGRGWYGYPNYSHEPLVQCATWWAEKYIALDGGLLPGIRSAAYPSVYLARERQRAHLSISRGVGREVVLVGPVVFDALEWSRHAWPEDRGYIDPTKVRTLARAAVALKRSARPGVSIFSARDRIRDGFMPVLRATIAQLARMEGADDTAPAYLLDAVRASDAVADIGARCRAKETSNQSCVFGSTAEELDLRYNANYMMRLIWYALQKRKWSEYNYAIAHDLGGTKMVAEFLGVDAQRIRRVPTSTVVPEAESLPEYEMQMGTISGGVLFVGIPGPRRIASRQLRVSTEMRELLALHKELDLWLGSASLKP